MTAPIGPWLQGPWRLYPLAIPVRARRSGGERAVNRPGEGECRMKAVGYTKSLPIDQAESLIDFEAAKPGAAGRDIRVAVKAVSVNPVDTKVRKRAAPR